MPVAKLTNSTKITKKEADTKIQQMHDAAKGKSNKHAMSKKPGDKQHPDNIIWALLDSKSKTLYSGSVPTTEHGYGKGGKNTKVAVATLNKAIDYLNGLDDA